MCYGIFENATTENTISVLKKGFEEYGKPREIMTDHGTQFVASRKDKKGHSKHKFGEFLEENGIKHILARVSVFYLTSSVGRRPLVKNHGMFRPSSPQTNGKIERFFGLVEAKKRFFKDIDELIEWYMTKAMLWSEASEHEAETTINPI